MLVPNATDILDSIAMARTDVLYASPTGLENVALEAMHTANPAWRRGFANLKEAHTGGAPVSRQMAETYAQSGLNVMQIFATTEAGMLYVHIGQLADNSRHVLIFSFSLFSFIAKPALTGHLCHLTPRPQLKDKLLFHQPDPANDTLELWLPPDFPGLQKAGLTFEPFPGNPALQAWNTSDQFARISASAPLYEFRGRSDDWLRLTSGTACRALEIEDRLTELMRKAIAENDSNANSPCSSISPSPSLSSAGSSKQSDAQDSNKSHVNRLEAVTALGNGRKSLSAVVQLQDCAPPSEVEAEAARTCAQIITEEQLQYPAVLQPEAILFATKDRAINITQKGSLQRRKNEEMFAPLLSHRGL